MVAELFAFGPLQQWMDAPDVEEIDVNSHLHTWVSYVDGRQVDVGQLWSSSTELVAFQKRIALRMGTGEGRLDTASPQLTLQSADGSRAAVALGGPTGLGILPAAGAAGAGGAGGGGGAAATPEAVQAAFEQRYAGERFVRVAVVQPDDRIAMVADRLANLATLPDPSLLTIWSELLPAV